MNRGIRYTRYESYSTDEALLIGTFRAHTPITEIDGKPIGDRSRPVLARL
ncbi:MAG: hypothetical protein GDA36_12330 [Rhodobacteraceae bacterium]|nr:hypothetical protein [Paracoccaceae bacterium]